LGQALAGRLAPCLKAKAWPAPSSASLILGRDLYAAHHFYSYSNPEEFSAQYV
jgi:hypothetical protein